MEKVSRKWTVEEERLLFNIMSNHSLSMGLKESAELLDRTESSCKAKWYAMKKEPLFMDSIAPSIVEPVKLTFFGKIKKVFDRILEKIFF